MAPQVREIVIQAATDFTTEALLVLVAIIGIGVGLLVFNFGISKLLYDQSLMIGGIYVRKLPYKGYKRFRSKAWNMKNTM